MTDRTSQPARSVERQLCLYECPASRRALKAELSAEGFDAVDEPAEPGAARQVRATAPVVLDLDRYRFCCRRQVYASFGRSGMLRGVREAFRDDVIEGGFYRFRKPERRNTR